MYAILDGYYFSVDGQLLNPPSLKGMLVKINCKIRSCMSYIFKMISKSTWYIQIKIYKIYWSHAKHMTSKNYLNINTILSYVHIETRTCNFQRPFLICMPLDIEMEAGIYNSLNPLLKLAFAYLFQAQAITFHPPQIDYHKLYT